MKLLESAQALADLVRRGKPDGRAALAPHANAVLEGYPSASAKSVTAAVALLDRSLESATKDADREIVRLVLGALVEGGASPELVWPAARRGLVETAARAQKAGPIALQARASLKSRAVLATACLLRSEDLRMSVQESESEMIEACRPFEVDLEEMLFLKQVAQILPDFTLLVIHPAQRRGFRVRVHEVMDNVELYVLVCDALVGTGRRGAIEGRRPSKKAIRIATDPTFETTKPEPVLVAFDLAHWHGRVYLDQVPREIPGHRGERVLLLGTRDEPSADRTIEGALDPLQPSVEIIQTLSSADVEKQLLSMSKAAALAAAAAASRARRSRSS